ncbi:GroES-like protein [Aulographum hederae CBS 113979]|uniref:GroES-like protein n=1 Tax=Aulographum hederae CBS 113979 TaxID=1176131 RepID=A0A6G1HD98_9PEZI|nr:GroES-like protein [Aulographum hederae CBS 113979]
MKALVFTTKGPIPSVLQVLSDHPKPSPGPNQSLVRIIASGINPADAKNVQGSFPQTTLPRVPGRDFAGVVEGGEEDGMEVWGTGGENGYTRDGSHAEYIIVDTAALASKPKNLSFSQAASCGVPFLTASAMVSKADVKPGKHVLVLGSSGSVGSSAVQICKFIGATPLESSRRSQAGAVDISADEIASQTANLSNGAGVSVVIDTVSDPALFKKALVTLNRGGKYIIITAPKSGDLAFNALDLYRADRTVTGVNSNSISFAESSAFLRKMTPGFENGTLTPPKVIHEVECEQDAVVRAYQGVLEGAKGKYVIVFGEKGKL